MNTIERIIKGRWQLLSEFDTKNFVSTVELAGRGIGWGAIDEFLRVAGVISHSCPYETITKRNGKWERAIGSETKERAREVHEAVLAKFKETLS